MKKNNKVLEQEKRAQTYGCDGNCYSDTSICPRIDYCPATRKYEGLAFVVVVCSAFILTLLGFGVAIYYLGKILM